MLAAIAAAEPPARRCAVLDTIVLQAHTARTLRDLRPLEQDLDAARARGFALDDGERAAKVRSLGAPVLDRHGMPLGAISLTVLVFQTSRAKLLALGPTVQGAAAKIAARLAPSITAEG